LPTVEIDVFRKQLLENGTPAEATTAAD
jgi:hypothetical protein